MRVVLDTNVLVSGLLSPDRAPAQVLRLILGGQLTVCHDPRVLLEYESVLLRPKFSFSKKHVFEIMHFFRDFGESIVAVPLQLSLPDPSDAPFFEVAVSGRAEYLITGNIKHFPKSLVKSVAVVAPAEFIKAFK